jgi:regulator of RNase E activity RraA
LPELVLPSSLRPLFPEKSFVGIAFTLEGTEIVPPVSWDEGKVRISSYLEVFDQLEADSVIVSKNNGSFVGHFGELTGNSAQKHGCVGVVLDGNLRDTAGLREIGMQVFYRDVNPRNSRRPRIEYHRRTREGRRDLWHRGIGAGRHARRSQSGRGARSSWTHLTTV